MKKLTPFQKKMARWYDDFYSIQALEGVAFIVLLVSAWYAVNAVLETKEMWKIAISTIASLAALYAVFLSNAIKFWKQFLAETQVKKAEQLAKDYPKYADRINKLICEAIIQDDGEELQNALEKFETEITALEKELGIE